MKKLKFIVLIFTFFGLIMGCSKDEVLVDELGEMSLKKVIKAPVFVVEPNGVDDTENLEKAFIDAIAAGPGAVVQLTEGEFYIDLIEVREFNGSLEGAGKGKTIISTIANLSVDEFIDKNLDVVLINFVGGDVFVRDLTIHTPQGPLSEGSIDFLFGQLGFCAITAQYVATDEYVNATVDNVEFITQGFVYTGLLVESGFWIGPEDGIPLGDIDISVTNSSFSGPFWGYGALLMEIREGNIMVGSKSNGNIFNNCDLGIWHNVNINASVNNNTFMRKNGWFPLQIVNGPWREDASQFPQAFQSFCNIENNTFNVSSSSGVVILNDYRRFFPSYEIPMLVEVKGNKIHTEGNGMFTAMGCLNLSEAVIRNNKFTGTADFGVRLFSQWPGGVLSENGLLLGNNFDNSEYSLTTVLLGNGTKNWTIVGGDLGELIWDFGENNIITGFNNQTSEVPIGQTIVDNLENIKNHKKYLKGH